MKLARSTLGADFAVEVKPNYGGDVSHLGVNCTATQKPIMKDSYLGVRLSLNAQNTHGATCPKPVAFWLIVK